MMFMWLTREVVMDLKPDEIVLLACAAEYELSGQAVKKLQKVLEKIEYNIASEENIGSRILSYGTSMGWISKGNSHG